MWDGIAPGEKTPKRDTGTKKWVIFILVMAFHGNYSNLDWC